MRILRRGGYLSGGPTPQSTVRIPLAAAPGSLGYSGRRPLVWWYLTELPQGRKAARAGELFQVRGGSSHALVAAGERRRRESVEPTRLVA
ncbi:MAG: hypothetical protein QOE58_683 [Actinomycetota bacterium]|nr:hypothetical protein [Actinomycetota bacterium]